LTYDFVRRWILRVQSHDESHTRPRLQLRFGLDVQVRAYINHSVYTNEVQTSMLSIRVNTKQRPSVNCTKERTYKISVKVGEFGDNK
jgi:hypothetical protein